MLFQYYGLAPLEGISNQWGLVIVTGALKTLKKVDGPFPLVPTPVSDATPY